MEFNSFSEKPAFSNARFPFKFAPIISTSRKYSAINQSKNICQNVGDLLKKDSISAENSESVISSIWISSTTLCLSGLTVILLIIAWYIIEDQFLEKIPGPKGIWPIGNSYKLWSSTDRVKVMTKWAKKYNPVCLFKVGTEKYVFLTSVSAVQKLLQSSDPGHLNKGYGYQVLAPFWNNGLVLSKFDKWRERRTIMAKAFTLRSLMGYMDVYNKQSKSLVEELAKLFPNTGRCKLEKSGGKPIDHILWQHALHVICEATMGTDIWGIEGSNKLTSLLDGSKDICMMRLMQFWLAKNWIWRWHPKSKILNEKATHFREFVCKVIEQRKQTMATAPTPSMEQNNDDLGMKSPFKSLIEEMMMAGIDDEGLIEEVSTFIGAGYESTATTLQFFLFCLALNPKHQEICREEIDRIFNDVSYCPDDSNGDLLYKSLGEMKHLERCLLETLRLFPVVFMYFRRLESPLEIDKNIKLPKGLNVGVFLPTIHQDPELFPNPEIFDPDRFLPENVRDRGQFSFLSFSAGPRNCIGFKFGINEAKIMVARILRHFVVETSDNLDSVALLSQVTLTPERGYNFILKKR